MASRVVHLELHTPDMAAACSFYRALLGWQPELLAAAGRSYHALDLTAACGGGIVECGTDRALWLPYAEVGCIQAATARASELGAQVTLEPRDGPAGWRSVVASPAGGEVALWQQKR